MTEDRKKIPLRTVTEIRYRNRNTCCICRDPKKGVVIHHIDGNRNNNDPSNLAVVCLEHHDEIHKKGGITRRISPELVKKFKHDWELVIRNQWVQRYGPLKTVLEKALFRFEIRKTCYELVTLKDDDTDGINQRLDFLTALNVLEVPTNQILRDLDYVLMLFVFSDANKACLVANRVHEFYYHLFSGPKYVKIGKRNKENLELAIRMIGTIGDSAAIAHNSRVMASTLAAFARIWDILVLYNLESYALGILDCLDKILEGCKIATEDEEPFTSGINEVSKLQEQLKAVAKQEKPEWKKVLTKLSK